MSFKLKSIIEAELNESIKFFPVGMGRIETVSGKRYFLKTGSSSRAYLCEANGLKELAKADEIRIAKVISAGENYILTENIERGIAKNDFFEDFGRRLAKLHRHESRHFGFYEDNFIGENPQLNIPDKDEKNNWTAFYFNKRLLFQYKLAEKNNYVSESLRKGFSVLESNIEKILQDSEEFPSLLHGDLWAGNFLCDKNGNPTLIDPAVYYGHREADLAMTKLFGGFPSSFYLSYMNEYPLKPNWEYREDIYKLYHVLNHLNIFGRGYLSEAEFIVGKYVK